MSRPNVEVLRATEFRTDVTLHAELLEVAAPSYVDPRALLNRDLSRCDTLYLARDTSGGLLGFYMTAFETLQVEQSAVPAMFLGMSASRQDMKDTGRITMLYARGLAEAMDWESRNAQRLVLWGTTVTPIVYLGVWSSLADVSPQPDGSYSPASLPIADAIRRHLGIRAEPAGHPFALEGIALDTHYSARERARIARVCRLKRFTLFDALGIDDTREDRLLFLGHTPKRPEDVSAKSVLLLAMSMRAVPAA